MRQLAKIINHGTYRVMYNYKAKYNPYRVTYTSCGHQKKIADYADYASALYHVGNMVEVNETILRGKMSNTP